MTYISACDVYIHNIIHNYISIILSLPLLITEPPSVSTLTYQEEARTLTCVSTGSAATTVSWMKDSQSLSIDGSTYQLTQTVTDRASSTYSNVLTVSETALTGVAGTYTCTVSNDLGSDSYSVIAVGEF